MRPTTFAGIFTGSALLSAALSTALAHVIWERALARTCHHLPHTWGTTREDRS